MNDIAAMKSAHNMDNGVAVTNIGEELIAKPFALAGTGDETSDIDESDSGWEDLCRAVKVGERLQATVWHGHDTRIWLDRCKRVISR
ncbi:hypothetical protein D3C79_757770 [compost metagenome]